jgi:hypothetical protein
MIDGIRVTDIHVHIQPWEMHPPEVQRAMDGKAVSGEPCKKKRSVPCAYCPRTFSKSFSTLCLASPKSMSVFSR